MKIRRRKYASGKIGWQLDLGRVDGKRWQKLFPTRAEAEFCAAEMRSERRMFGDVAAAMSHATRLRFADAEFRLARAGVSLELAVSWALARAGNVREMKTLAEVKTEFLADRERRNKRVRYVQQLGVSLGSFVRGREARPAGEVTRAEVEGWLFANGWSGKTQRNYLGDLRALFNWARGRHFAGENPCTGVQPADANGEAEIEVLAPEEVARLFATAVFSREDVFDRKARAFTKGFVYHRLLGYLALATFCGIRPEEVKRSGTTALDLDGRVFVVAGDVAKTGKRRVVDLPVAAVAWLKFWRGLCGVDAPLVPKNFRAGWERLRERAELKRSRGAVAGTEWKHDALRHTCATMHFAVHQDGAALKAQLGHSDREETLFSNYRAVRLGDGRPVSKALAAKFWAILPTRAMRNLRRAS